MPTVSADTLAATATRITQPGYLVEVLFDPPFRVSTRGDTTILGSEWRAWDVQIQGIAKDSASVAQNGTLVFGNPGLELSAYALGQKFNDRRVRIWAFDARAIGDDDPVLVFDGVGGKFSIAGNGDVTVQIERRGSRTLYSPRRYITPQQGFTYVIPPGMTFTFNGEVFTFLQDKS